MSDANVEVPTSNRIYVPFLITLVGSYFNNVYLNSETPTLL
jgi:hypothetical protein